MEKYFAVETKCGHVGKNKCIYVWFPVKAENGKEAAAKAKNIKRVKRHHKDVIRQTRKITRDDYIALMSFNDFDPYLKCKNIQQQRELVDLTGRIEPDEYLISKSKKQGAKRDTSYSLKKKAIQERDAIRRIREDYDDDIAV